MSVNQQSRGFEPMKAIALSICLLTVATGSIATELQPEPPLPRPVTELVVAHPFTLATGYAYDWSEDRPIVRSGLLVVLRVEPDLVFPRNAAEPVLYAGDRTVQRLNQGYESGHVIAIIPGEIDLTRAPIWFGRPELPERVTTEMIKAERALAERAEIQPLSADKLRLATRSSVQVSDLYELLREHAADLVLEYSPQESDLAKTWRLPVAKAEPEKR